MSDQTAQSLNKALQRRLKRKIGGTTGRAQIAKAKKITSKSSKSKLGRRTPFTGKILKPLYRVGKKTK